MQATRRPCIGVTGPASGGMAAACEDNGVVQAIEDPRRTFLIGV
jgi:hypothetical protein